MYNQEVGAILIGSGCGCGMWVFWSRQMVFYLNICPLVMECIEWTVVSNIKKIVLLKYIGLVLIMYPHR